MMPEISSSNFAISFPSVRSAIQCDYLRKGDYGCAREVLQGRDADYGFY